MNYYSIWDHTNNRLGLVPHKTSVANTVTVTTLPTRIFTPTSSLWNNIILGLEVAGGIAGVMGVGGTVFLAIFVILYETGIISAHPSQFLDIFVEKAELEKFLL